MWLCKWKIKTTRIFLIVVINLFAWGPRSFSWPSELCFWLPLQHIPLTSKLLLSILILKGAHIRVQSSLFFRFIRLDNTLHRAHLLIDLISNSRSSLPWDIRATNMSFLLLNLYLMIFLIIVSFRLLVWCLYLRWCRFHIVWIYNLFNSFILFEYDGPGLRVRGVCGTDCAHEVRVLPLL